MLDRLPFDIRHQGLTRGGSLKSSTRLVASVAAAAAATVIGGAVPTAGAEPPSQSSWYKLQLDPVTTKLVASDPAQAFAEATWSAALPESLQRWATGFFYTSLLAQSAAAIPNGCVELHFRSDDNHAYTTASGTVYTECPWLVPSLQPETNPGPFAYWERGEAR
jgi:hypothetical protein